MIKKLVLLILLCPLAASAQTWQKALQGAEKAFMRPGAATVASSRAALLKARETMPVSTNQQIELWLNGRISPVTPALAGRLSAWATLSNRLMLKDQPLRAKQIQFFAEQNTVPQGALSVFPSKQSFFPQRLEEKVRYVLFAGKEGDTQAEAAFKKAVAQYREAFPNKKVIVLSESLPDRGVKFVSEFNAPDKQKGFVRAFVRDGFSVAGLGDVSPKPEGCLQQDKTNLIISAAEVPAAQAARSFHLFHALAKWKAEFPQAVFLVYVSPMAAAYDWRYSLANALPKEEVFSVSITSVRNSREFLFHRWSNFKYAQGGVLLWNDPAWARMSGFDAQIIVP